MNRACPAAGNGKVPRLRFCFNTPAPDDPNLWPSDYVGVWADLESAENEPSQRSAPRQYQTAGRLSPCLARPIVWIVFSLGRSHA